MSLELRRELVSLARRYDALLISDDVYDFLAWPEDPTIPDNEVARVPARLVDIDRVTPGRTQFGNAVSNGSFSKLIGPGIRVGWAEGSPDFVKHLGNW
jgi:DNA-binding transcriptional MocR family regulator